MVLPQIEGAGIGQVSDPPLPGRSSGFSHQELNLGNVVSGIVLVELNVDFTRGSRDLVADPAREVLVYTFQAIKYTPIDQRSDLRLRGQGIHFDLGAGGNFAVNRDNHFDIHVGFWEFLVVIEGERPTVCHPRWLSL